MLKIKTITSAVAAKTWVMESIQQMEVAKVLWDINLYFPDVEDEVIGSWNNNYKAPALILLTFAPGTRDISQTDHPKTRILTQINKRAGFLGGQPQSGVAPENNID